MSFMCLFDPVPLSGSQVYDTPPMAMKGPPSRDGQEIYDTPPSVDKSQRHYQQTVILHSDWHKTSLICTLMGVKEIHIPWNKTPLMVLHCQNAFRIGSVSDFATFSQTWQLNYKHMPPPATNTCHPSRTLPTNDISTNPMTANPTV